MTARALIAALALSLSSACARTAGDQPAASAAPARELPVQRAGATVERLRVDAGDAVDLWELCDRPGVSAVAAKGEGGRFVHGACKTRGQRQLQLRWDGTENVVELRGGGHLIAQVSGVGAIALVAEQPGTAAPAELIVVFADGSERRVRASAIAAAERANAESGGGAPLQALLAGAGVEPQAAARLTIVAGGGATPERYELDGTALSAPEHELALRYNRRGQLRFSHRAGDRELARLRGVERVIVHGR